jgi:REP element-mobilizing transposase RayT
MLFIDVLRAQSLAGKLTIHNFVIMPNHVHILLSIPGELSIQKAVQLIKGTGLCRRGVAENLFRGGPKRARQLHRASQVCRAEPGVGRSLRFGGRVPHSPGYLKHKIPESKQQMRTSTEEIRRPQALNVVCHEVVDIEARAADGCHVVEASMGSMPVVVMDPRKQVLPSLL